MKTNRTNRVLIPGNGKDNQAIATAMKLGIELSKKVAGDIEGVALFVPSKKSIRQASLEKVVSTRIAKLLEKGEQIPMGCGLGLRAVTTRTLKNGGHRDIVIVIGADSKMMAKVDKMSDLHTVIAVPQKDGALDGWAATWSPLIPGVKRESQVKVVKVSGTEKKMVDHPVTEEKRKNKSASTLKMINDSIVETALSALAGSIDLSKRSLDGQDRRQVENMIRLLKQNNHKEDPANIHDWAVNNGWLPETAVELVQIWQRVYGLKEIHRIMDAA